MVKLDTGRDSNVLQFPRQPKPARPSRIDNDGDLADYLIDQIIARSGTKPIVFAGLLYEYDPPTGRWKAQELSVLAKEIQSSNRKLRPKDGKHETIGVPITARMRKDTLDNIITQCDSIDFFRDSSAVTFKNGCISVSESGVELLEQSPNNRANFGYDFSYASGAEPQELIKFLHEIWRDDTDKDAKINLVRQFIGLCILGRVTKFERCLIFYGQSGDNGKSILLELIESLFPQELIGCIKPHDWHKEYYAAELAKARINVIHELPSADLVNSEAFKSVVSGNRMNGRTPYGRIFNFYPHCGHIFNSNVRLVSQDQTQAFWKRIVVIEFNRKFEHTKLREEILNPMRAEHKSIICWAIESVPGMLAKKQFTLPGSTITAKETWSEQDPVKVFLRNCCTDGRTATGAFHAAFNSWAQSTGHRPLSQPKLRERLECEGIKIKRGTTSNVYTTAVKPRTDWVDFFDAYEPEKWDRVQAATELDSPAS